MNENVLKSLDSLNDAIAIVSFLQQAITLNSDDVAMSEMNGLIDRLNAVQNDFSEYYRSTKK